MVKSSTMPGTVRASPKCGALTSAICDAYFAATVMKRITVVGLGAAGTDRPVFAGPGCERYAGRCTHHLAGEDGFMTNLFAQQGIQFLQRNAGFRNSKLDRLAAPAIGEEAGRARGIGLR